jgi:hypothetical protein
MAEVPDPGSPANGAPLVNDGSLVCKKSFFHPLFSFEFRRDAPGDICKLLIVELGMHRQ